MKRIMIVLLVLAACAAKADLTISNLNVSQLSPWRINITYTVEGVLPSDKDASNLVVELYDKETGLRYLAKDVALSGDIPLTLGEHRVVWDTTKDGIKFKSKQCEINVKYQIPSYCVIDLSGGPDAKRYPVSYLYEAPISWSNEYKTNKLVLKRIESGSFKMLAAAEIYNSNSSMPDYRIMESANITLTKTYYIGIFEVTRKQWKLVMGSLPLKNKKTEEQIEDVDDWPVDYVSYDMIRGSSKGSMWPSSSDVDESSFLGKLREKTGIDFDLPTEAQWDYACRAGTTTNVFCGDSPLEDYMWYIGNWDGTCYHSVGTKLPNPWGVYDMYGNVGEWCLDHFDITTWLEGGVDPKGPSVGQYPNGLFGAAGEDHRVQRGGCSISYYEEEPTNGVTLHGRPYEHDFVGSIFDGFRLARTW